MTSLPHIILYSKPGCHLCEAAQAQLQQIKSFRFELEVRDITTRADWFAAYQYEIPVVTCDRGDHEERLPRFSSRTPLARVEQLLQNALKL
ncbi:MAG: glutaredoxin family protein [Spirulinaceae cyanobacterium RM2_2_10]|nr:glutaredoxin family protein [Spirulinaceae cyanobacterium SM2_1_0]NJO18820.1 glutaredoxin family protein [Spirulinaceae cyanobacterium RM2_2_10]